MYEIWIAYLDTDLPDCDNPPVFMEDCDTYELAVIARTEYRDHETAAWIVNKETREIIS